MSLLDFSPRIPLGTFSILHSDTCSDDYLDDNDVNSDDDGRDDHVTDDNDDTIEKNQANRSSDFQRKIDAFKPNAWNGFTWVKN